MSKVIGIRLDDAVYAQLEARVGKQSIGEYIKELIVNSVNTHLGVNAVNTPDLVNTANYRSAFQFPGKS